LIKKLASKYEKVRVCYEAGPTGYGLYRQIITLGHECTVVAPSLIPKKPGDRIKTNRRDAVTLARLFRAGELTSVWLPDAVHEAVRDLVRARDTAAADVRKKRQRLLSFLLRHGRIYSGSKHWTRAHARWLATQAFEHPAQQIVFQDAIDAIEDCASRLNRLEEQLLAIVPNWSMAPVVDVCNRADPCSSAVRWHANIAWKMAGLCANSAANHVKWPWPSVLASASNSAKPTGNVSVISSSERIITTPQHGE
jgi:transposase